MTRPTKQQIRVHDPVTGEEIDRYQIDMTSKKYYLVEAAIESGKRAFIFAGHFRSPEIALSKAKIDCKDDNYSHFWVFDDVGNVLLKEV